MTAASAVLDVLDLDPQDLADSPLQPRSFYDPDHIGRLEASMRAGWRPRLRARRLVTAFTGSSGSEPVPVVELIYGHCRKRAAIAAGLTTVEVEIVEATDGEALDMIAAENLGRSSLTLLDEAALFARRRELLAVESPELVGAALLAEVAAHVGETVGRVRACLRLLDLVDEAKAALRAGLSLSLATQLAPLQAADQRRGLAWLKEQESREGAPPSRHALAKWVAQHVLCDLAFVGWELHDAGLPGGACAACPKRSGAEVEMFPGVKAGEDRCADPVCFKAKGEEFLGRQRTKLQEKAGFDAKGAERPLLELAAAFECYDDGLAREPYLDRPLARDFWKPVEKGQRKTCLAPTQGIVVVAEPGQAQREGELVLACFERSCPVHWASEPPLKGTPEQKEQRKAELAKERLEAEVVRLTILGVSSNIAQVGHDEEDLRLVARALWSGMDPSARARWAGIAEVAPKDAHEALIKTLGRRGADTGSTVDEVLAVVVQLALCQDLTLGAGKELAGAAKRARVKAADVLETAKANLEPAKPKAAKPEVGKPAKKAKAKKGGGR